MRWEGTFDFAVVSEVARAALYYVHGPLSACTPCHSGCDFEEVADSTSARWSWSFFGNTLWAKKVVGY